MKLKKIYPLILFVLLIQGCAKFSHQNLKRRDLSQYYVPTEITQYFLQEIPNWANFSTAGACKRTVPARHLDFPKLRSSLGLTYEEAVSFQYAWSKRINDWRKRPAGDLAETKEIMPFQDEAKIFHEVTEWIRGGRRHFIPPKYDKIHLIWLDKAINSPKDLQSLKDLMKKPLMDQAPPVFISLCLSHDEMEEFLKKLGGEGQTFNYLPYEIFSIYNENNGPQNFFSVHLNSLFRPGSKLHLFAPGSKIPVPGEFGGTFQVHSY